MGLESAELILKIEEEFGITFTDEEAASIVTVADFRDAIHAKVPPRSFTADYIFDRVRYFLVHEFGVEPELVSPNARIVRDLGID